MPLQDLTTLSRVRTWLAIEDNKDAANPILQQEITRLSAVTLSWLGYSSILPAIYNDILSGTGSCRILLKQRPVTKITSFTASGVSIPANTQPPGMGTGWTLEPWDGYCPAKAQQLFVSGYGLPRGMANIGLTYTAGYQASVTMQVPTSAPYELCPDFPAGMFAVDAGVTLDGTALTPVTGDPSAMQYTPAAPLFPDDSTGKPKQSKYVFNAAQAGANVVITGGFIPYTIENAVCELVGERFKYRDRIGSRSKSLGGQEVMSYDVNDLPKWFTSTLQPFKNVLPV